MKKILIVGTFSLISAAPLNAVWFSGKYLRDLIDERRRQRAALAEFHPEAPRIAQQVQPFLQQLTPEQQLLQQEYAQSLSQAQLQQIISIGSQNPAEQADEMILQVLSPEQQTLLQRFIQSFSTPQLQAASQLAESMHQSNNH